MPPNSLRWTTSVAGRDAARWRSRSRRAQGLAGGAEQRQLSTRARRSTAPSTRHSPAPPTSPSSRSTIRASRPIPWSRARSWPIAIRRTAVTRFAPRTQTPFRLRETVADVLGMAELDLRVVSPDVGGGFGMKSQVYPEDVLVLWAARRLGRPVKWTGERSECHRVRRSRPRTRSSRRNSRSNAEGRILALRAPSRSTSALISAPPPASAPNNAIEELQQHLRRAR